MSLYTLLKYIYDIRNVKVNQVQHKICFTVLIFVTLMV